MINDGKQSLCRTRSYDTNTENPNAINLFINNMFDSIKFWFMKMSMHEMYVCLISVWSSKNSCELDYNFELNRKRAYNKYLSLSLSLMIIP